MSNKQKKTLGIILCRNNSSRLKNKLKLKIGKKKKVSNYFSKD